MPVNKCPVCDDQIDEPIAVETPKGEVIVCCDECAENVKKDHEQ